MVALDTAAGATINNAANTISFNIAASVTLDDTMAFSLVHAIDFRTPGGSSSTTITMVDDALGKDGLTYGRTLRPSILDNGSCAYYVAAPVPAGNSLHISAPMQTVSGALIRLVGPPGTGIPPTGIQFAQNGGAFSDPFYGHWRNDSRFDCYQRAGAVNPAATVSVRRSDLSGTGATSPAFAIVAPTNKLSGIAGISAASASSLVLSFDTMNVASMYQDTAATQPITSSGQLVRAWREEIHGVELLTVPGNSLIPTLDMRTFDQRPGLNFIYGTRLETATGTRSWDTALTAKDWTLLVASRMSSYNSVSYLFNGHPYSGIDGAEKYGVYASGAGIVFDGSNGRPTNSVGDRMTLQVLSWTQATGTLTALVWTGGTLVAEQTAVGSPTQSGFGQLVMQFIGNQHEITACSAAFSSPERIAAMNNYLLPKWAG
ncbi:MAG: hypothetical protein NVSMB18_16470 [Acetobacteraceae bacterium]